MSWPQKLLETYDNCAANDKFTDCDQIVPPNHTTQLVHIIVTLSSSGNFLRAEVITDKDVRRKIIPATEKSAGRTSGAAPHPLIDSLEYCAKDFNRFVPQAEKRENKRLEKQTSFEKQLNEWCASPYAHLKAKIVRAYLQKGQLTADLVNAAVLPVDDSGHLLDTWVGEGEKPPIFSALGNQHPRSALVAWRVQIEGESNIDTWGDPGLQKAWMEYDLSTMGACPGLCMVTGQNTLTASNHPRNIRRPGDGAKLISGNDSDGYTFRGKFDAPSEVATVGYETSHKIHSALRWLTKRQGYYNGDQVIVAWAVNAELIPQPIDDSWLGDCFFTSESAEDSENENEQASWTSDAGQLFSINLSKVLSGYSGKLKPNDDIMIIGLDSASPGRLAITFFREKFWSDYLETLEKWQRDLAWLRPVKLKAGAGKEQIKKFVCAPTPLEIAQCAYGHRLDDGLKKATVERLLCCIADAVPIPVDLAESCVRKASARCSFEKDIFWEIALGVACAIYKGFKARSLKQRREYSMTLEADYSSRDYLYGRLLAVAEHLESLALYLAQEQRATNAERLMQHFADHPYHTWLILEKAIQPYRLRLSRSRPGFVGNMDKLLDEILSSFLKDDFTKDDRLSGEFLLGYHCQRQILRQNKDNNTAEEMNHERSDQKN